MPVSPTPPVYEQPDEDRPSSAEPPAPPDAAAAGATTLDDQPAELPVEEKHDAYAAFRFVAYRLFLLSFVLATLSAQIQSSTIKYELYERTGKEEALGWIGLAQAAPLLLFALVAGQVADTFSRKRVLLFAQLVLIVCPATLAVLYYTHHLTPMATYVMLGINALGLTFARPARQALLPSLVPARVFPNAAAWNSSVFETSGIIGPLVGAVLLALYSAGLALAVSAISMTACLIITSTLPVPPRPKATTRPGLSDLIAGVRFVFKTRLMLAAITLDLFAVLLGGAVFMLAPFSKLLGVGKIGYGVMTAAPAVGAVMMAVVLAHAKPFRKAGHALLCAVTAFGLSTIAFGAASLIFPGRLAFIASLAALFVIGMADNVSVVIRHTLEQLLTPDSMRGRVSAVNQVFIGSSNDLGGLESGLTAWWFGLRASVIGGGIGTLLVVGIITARFPQLRRLGRLQDIKPAQP